MDGKEGMLVYTDKKGVSLSRVNGLIEIIEKQQSGEGKKVQGGKVDITLMLVVFAMIGGLDFF